MKLQVSTSYLDPIEVEKYEWVTVRLTSGHEVTVFDDAVYVATQEETFKHKDGTKVWQVREPASRGQKG